MTSVALDPVEQIVQDVTEHRYSAGQALGILRRRGLTPNMVALLDACDALHARDGLAGGLIDPLDWLEADPRTGLHALDVAIARAEDQLEQALRVLARPGLAAVAS